MYQIYQHASHQSRGTLSHRGRCPVIMAGAHIGRRGHAIVCGSSYASPKWRDLAAPAGSAIAMGDALVTACAYKPEHVHLLVREDVTVRAIQQRIEEVASRGLRSGDTLVFFFSGYGVLVGGDVFVVDVGGETLAVTTVHQRLATALRQRNVANVTVIYLLDCFRNVGKRRGTLLSTPRWVGLPVLTLVK